MYEYCIYTGNHVVNTFMLVFIHIIHIISSTLVFIVYVPVITDAPSLPNAVILFVEIPMDCKVLIIAPKTVSAFPSTSGTSSRKLVWMEGKGSWSTYL